MTETAGTQAEDARLAEDLRLAQQQLREASEQFRRSADEAQEAAAELRRALEHALKAAYLLGSEGASPNLPTPDARLLTSDS